jgi:hypothetical protein
VIQRVQGIVGRRGAFDADDTDAPTIGDVSPTTAELWPTAIADRQRLRDGQRQIGNV